MIGIKFGHELIVRTNQWQVMAMYRRLERNAWLDIFPDPDAYSGGTNAKGFEAVLIYGLRNNVTLAFDYYYMERIRGRSRSENILQVDLSLQF